MKKEIRPIPDFPKYFISNNGIVYSLQPRSNQPPPKKMRVLARGKAFGYDIVNLMRDKKGHKRFVHRLVLEAFVGKAPSGYECQHLDGNRSNNNLSNLKWGTRKENQMDRVRHGTSNRGERHPNHKLSKEEVIEIKKLATAYNKKTRSIDKGGNYAEIAKRFGVSKSAVEAIVRGTSWGWLFKEV